MTPMWKRRMVTGTGVAVLLASGALAACTPSGGGTVSLTSDGTLVFTAASGKANNVVLTTAVGDNLVLVDGGDRVNAGTRCTQDGDNRVLCPANAVARITMFLLDGNDSAVNGTTLGTSNDGIQGGPGDDVITGGSDNERLSGDAGRDTLNGGPGNDTLREAINGADVDVVDADVFIGGSGGDLVTYSTTSQSSTMAVTADLDGVADDGQPGERDEIRTDVENLTGTALGNDTLVGNAAPNVLDGLGGNDSLRGGGGTDTLRGQGDADFLEGDSGDDTLRGGAGFDGLRGGIGIDDCDVEADGGTELDCEV